MSAQPDLGITRQVASTPGDPLDRHYTPDALAGAVVDRLIRRWLVHDGDQVVEPSCGGGAFVRALQARDFLVHGYDLDPDAEGLALADIPICGDWLDQDGVGAYAVVGNPPFGGPPDYLGLQHARHALDVAPVVALILPWSWLGTPSPRAVMRGRLPCEVWPIAPRPWPRSVRETAVWVWRRGHDGPTAIGEPVVWR